jgi:hypothetical protein
VTKLKYGEQNGKGNSQTGLSKLRGQRSQRSEGESLPDYAHATPGWVVAAIIAVTKRGGAIQFGLSRDGGVYTIVILLEGEIEKNYVKESEGIDQFLEGVYHDFDESPGRDKANGAGGVS